MLFNQENGIYFFLMSLWSNAYVSKKNYILQQSNDHVSEPLAQK